jgi:hypothetical protein
MRLPAILKPADTSTKLTATRNLLAAAEARIERLRADRTAALAVDSDSIEAVRKIDVQLAAERGSIDAYQDRIAVLERRLADEQQEFERVEHEKWIDRIEAALPKRLRAAGELATAIKAAAVALQKYKDETSTIRKDWLPDTFFPLSADAADGLVERAFVKSPYIQADTEADRFLAAVAEKHTAMIHDLRHPYVPEPVEYEVEPEAAIEEVA